jgi:hypothetical protein
MFLLLQLTADWFWDDMAAVMNKRQFLSVEKELKVIREIENVKKKADICQEFYLIHSVIQTIWKNRTKIIRVFVQNRSRIKQFHKPE